MARVNRMISFGYGLKDGNLSVNSDEANIVKCIFKEYIEGRTLANIASDMVLNKVFFNEKDFSWNKNKIARIIENEKYTGCSGYPAIISIDDFKTANKIKHSKAKIEVEIDDRTAFIKNKVFCEKCGNIFKRRNERGKNERWKCNGGCKFDKKISDKYIMENIKQICREIVDNPELIIFQKDVISYRPDYEIMQYSSEVKKLLKRNNIVYSTGKKLILKYADEKYKRCNINGNKAYSYYLYNRIKSFILTDDIKYLDGVIEKIMITENEKVKICFKNGVNLCKKEE